MNGAVEGPRVDAQLEPRAHTVFPRSRSVRSYVLALSLIGPVWSAGLSQCPVSSRQLSNGVYELTVILRDTTKACRRDDSWYVLLGGF